MACVRASPLPPSSSSPHPPSPLYHRHSPRQLTQRLPLVDLLVADSYGANVHSSRLAKKEGFDDALLLAQGYGVDDSRPSDDPERVVLDGPNFAVSWLRDDGVFCTPSWEALGMLQSCTCTIGLKAAQRLGIPIDEGVHRLGEVQSRAKAVWVQSTGNDLTPVTRLGGLEMGEDSGFRSELLGAIAEIVRETP